MAIELPNPWDTSRPPIFTIGGGNLTTPTANPDAIRAQIGANIVRNAGTIGSKIPRIDWNAVPGGGLGGAGSGVPRPTGVTIGSGQLGAAWAAQQRRKKGKRWRERTRLATPAEIAAQLAKAAAKAAAKQPRTVTGTATSSRASPDRATRTATSSRIGNAFRGDFVADAYADLGLGIVHAIRDLRAAQASKRHLEAVARRPGPVTVEPPAPAPAQARPVSPERAPEVVRFPARPPAPARQRQPLQSATEVPNPAPDLSKLAQTTPAPAPVESARSNPTRSSQTLPGTRSWLRVVTEFGPVASALSLLPRAAPSLSLTAPRVAPRPLTPPQQPPVKSPPQVQSDDACKRCNAQRKAQRKRQKKGKDCRNPTVSSRVETRGGKRYQITKRWLKCPVSSRKKSASARA